MRKLIGLAVPLALLTTTLTPLAAHATDQRRKPKEFANCTAMHRVYPHGVARRGARDVVRGNTQPVTRFVVYTKMYKKNTKSDRDHDGVACEQL